MDTNDWRNNMENDEELWEEMLTVAKICQCLDWTRCEFCKAAYIEYILSNHPNLNYNTSKQYILKRYREVKRANG